jgi:hypothetical protein
MIFIRALISFLLRRFIFKTAANFAAQRTKRSLALIYLKALSAIRRSLLTAICVFIFLQLMVFGLIGTIIATIYLLPVTSLETKFLILLGVSLFLLIIPLSILIFMFSERNWLRHSGAQALLQDLTPQPTSEPSPDVVVSGS